MAYLNLGATAAETQLAVKAYVVSGVTVWGSYQSPTADKTLQNLKKQINRFGANLDVNGLIGPKTRSAMQQIVRRYTGAQEIIDKVNWLLTIANNGEEQIARNGLQAWSYMKDLADYANMPTSGPAPISPPVVATGGTPKPTASNAARESGAALVPIVPPSVGVFQRFSNLGSTEKLVMGAGFVAVAYLVGSKMKPSRSSSARRSSRRY